MRARIVAATVAAGIVLSLSATPAAAATPVVATGLVSLPPGGACVVSGGTPRAHVTLTVDIDTGAGHLVMIGGCGFLNEWGWNAGECAGTRTGDISCASSGPPVGPCTCPAFLSASGQFTWTSYSGNLVRLNAPADDPTTR